MRERCNGAAAADDDDDDDDDAVPLDWSGAWLIINQSTCRKHVHIPTPYDSRQL